ncbi:MAG: hypothetical protein WC346_04070 [Methanogenium sp.]|jgi:hypothetical protein
MRNYELTQIYDDKEYHIVRARSGEILELRLSDALNMMASLRTKGIACKMSNPYDKIYVIYQYVESKRIIFTPEDEYVDVSDFDDDVLDDLSIFDEPTEAPDEQIDVVNDIKIPKVIKSVLQSVGYATHCIVQIKHGHGRLFQGVRYYPTLNRDMTAYYQHDVASSRAKQLRQEGYKCRVVKKEHTEDIYMLYLYRDDIDGTTADNEG